LFTSKTPHFFKIILDDTVQDGKLGIPRSFVKKHGKDLPNSVLLKVPSGAEWKVELKRCDGEVWLQNGWKEFAKYYFVGFGHLLVFRYEQNSYFSVVIFDPSCSEIRYSYTTTHREDHSNRDKNLKEPEKEETGDDISVEILESPCPKTRMRSPLSCPRPYKVMRSNSTDKINSTHKLNTSSELRHKETHAKGEDVKQFKSELKSQCYVQELGGYFVKEGGEGTNTYRRGPRSEILEIMQPISAVEKAEHFQRAYAYKSDNPLFAVIMQPSCVKHRYELYLPSAISKKYFTKEQGDVFLYNPDGKTWSGNYIVRTSSHGRARLGRIWRVFAEDNHLNVGDVCVFELIKGTEISMKVFIFRMAEETDCHLSPTTGSEGNQFKPMRSLSNEIDSDFINKGDAGISSSLNQFTAQGFKLPQVPKIENRNIKQVKCEERPSRLCNQRSSCTSVPTPRALAAATEFISEYPFFKKVVQPSHLSKCNVTVGHEFIKMLNQQIGEQNVTLQIAERSWPVKLICYPKHGKLSKGWLQFARENSLRLGDVCIFELIKRDEAVFKVFIIRGD
ncbi:B3 domain-containing protein, partial [Cephalotus follicularis]